MSSTLTGGTSSSDSSYICVTRRTNALKNANNNLGKDVWFADLKANLTLLKREVRGWVQRLNSVSEITAVKPVKGRDTEMYPIEFN